MSPLIGIDLGTTNSALAVMDPTGRPVMVPNKEGSNTTPSCVFFELGNVKHTVVGQAAKDQAVVYPDRVFKAFKRDMSTNAEKTLDGEVITPIELSALVLKKLVQDAQGQVGPIRDAVITVPANFTNEARLATIKAGELAGLTVSHIINEPTAAIFYYAYHQPISGTVLVYDFGGGTLDVTVAHIEGKDVRIIASKGDPRLGGIDFDQKLEEIIARTFHASTGEALDPAVHQLAKTPEEYKWQLSARTDVTVQVTGGRSGRKILSITRQEFEAATDTLVSKADLLVDSTLDEAKLKTSDIAAVLLVGGSTRMPMVVNHLTKLFGKPPICHINPDEVVALGAALYAGQQAKPGTLTPGQHSVVTGMRLQDVANHFFGTLTLDATDGVRKLVNSVIIEKNTALPCSKTEKYYTVGHGQTQVDCQVTQSATRETDPEFVRIIWNGQLGPLPPDRPSNKEIRVTYSYDKNQVMHCLFEDVESGIRQWVELGLETSAEESGSIDRYLVE